VAVPSLSLLPLGLVVPGFLVGVVLFPEALAQALHRGRRGNDGGLTRPPVGRQRQAFPGVELEAVHHPQNFIHVAAQKQRVVDESPHNPFVVDKEDGADRHGRRGVRRNHPVQARDLLVQVADDGEGNADAEVFLDVGQPRQVRADRVDGEANQFRVSLLKLRSQLRESDKLGRSDRGEVGWVRKQHHPLSPVVAETNGPFRRRSLKVGRLVPDEGNGGAGLLHAFTSFPLRATFPVLCLHVLHSQDLGLLSARVANRHPEAPSLPVCLPGRSANRLSREYVSSSTTVHVRKEMGERQGRRPLPT
jgi:hypothetical protein